MKKFLCLALCAAMLLALAVGVGAQEITSSTGSGNVEIQASYTAKSDNKADIEAGARGHQGVLSDPELGADRVHQLQCRQDHLQLEPENAEL